MSLYRRGPVWWYRFEFSGRIIQESSKSHSKTVARAAEQTRRRELEQAYNGLADSRDERIRGISELASEYLTDYKIRHPKSETFAEYALEKVTDLLGSELAVDITPERVMDYQTARLKAKAAPKSVNEEVGFLLRMLGERGDLIRIRLRKQKALKLSLPASVARAYTDEEKAAMLATAKTLRSPHILPALSLALHCGLRDGEIRKIQWSRLDLENAIVTVGDAKTQAGAGRTIPLNSEVLSALVAHREWYLKKFHETAPDWYVFPFGKPQPTDPTRPAVTFKTAWHNVREKAALSGRWHDARHTFITGLAESGEASDETIRNLAGHVSPQMLKHYSHIGMQARRRAVEALIAKPAAPDANAEAPAK